MYLWHFWQDNNFFFSFFEQQKSQRKGCRQLLGLCTVMSQLPTHLTKPDVCQQPLPCLPDRQVGAGEQTQISRSSIRNVFFFTGTPVLQMFTTLKFKSAEHCRSAAYCFHVQYQVFIAYPVPYCLRSTQERFNISFSSWQKYHSSTPGLSIIILRGRS